MFGCGFPWGRCGMIENHAGQSEARFRRARLRAWVSGVRGRLGRRLTELVSLPEVRTRIQVSGQRDLGMISVPLHEIIGSEGRRGDFDRHFAPRRGNTIGRWQRIERARRAEQGLPPVELIKLGAIYFVRDGHHRLSVARQAGQLEIDAHVIEMTTNVPLGVNLDQRDLARKGAQSTFVERSGISRGDLSAYVPDEASAPATYDTLLHHIDTHGYYMGQVQGTSVSREAAGVHWYQTLYRPMIAAIRERNLRRAFRGQTESDLYLRIMDHRHYLTAETGRDPGPDAALLDYVARFSSWCARRAFHLRRTDRSLRSTATVSAAAGRTVTIWEWLGRFIRRALVPAPAYSGLMERLPGVRQNVDEHSAD
jgi:hypothetical protein